MNSRRFRSTLALLIIATAAFAVLSATLLSGDIWNVSERASQRSAGSAQVNVPGDAGNSDGDAAYDSDRFPLHLSVDGTYTFPVAAPFDLLEWTEYHWDGGNAVDIFAASELEHNSVELEMVHSAPVVAVAAGTAVRKDNPWGGAAIVLRAENGMQFYYSHLADPAISGRAEVTQGQPIGRLGRSGERTQFIEPHLHFEVIDGWYDDLNWPDDINAARWIRRHFGVPWVERDTPDYPAARPEGTPVPENVVVREDFPSMRRRVHPQIAGVILGPASPEPDRKAGTQRVYSIHTGEVSVMRNTELGLRVQVTNRPTDTTIVYSHLSETHLGNGDVVEPGDRIGTFHDTLHVMFFDDDRPEDPTGIPGWNVETESRN